MASCLVGLIAVPHRVQNLSLGTASFPHSAQTHPVRRKRTRRALIRSPPPGPPPGPAAGPLPYGPAAVGDPGAIGGAYDGGGGTTVGGGGMVADAGVNDGGGGT